MTEKDKEKKYKRGDVLKKITKDLSSNYWAIASVVLAVVLLIVVFNPSSTGGVISDEEAGNIVLNLIKMQVDDAELSSVDFEDGIFTVIVNVQGQESPVYLTADGKSILPAVYSVETIIEQSKAATQEASSTTEETTIPTSDKPKAELFVMTHCPYGTQAEKGFIPLMRAFSEFADLKIRYVHYFMHEPEYDETPIEVCIREEQSDKYLDYLECFLEGDGDDSSGYITNGNDPEVCMERAGVDAEAVETCVVSNKWEEYYAEDSELSESYGVRGSPTLVINGVIASYGRSAASYLTGVCTAFSDAPEECSTLELSTQNPSVYFGWSTSGSATATGAC